MIFLSGAVALTAGAGAGEAQPLGSATNALEPAPVAPAYSSAFEGYRPFDAGEVQNWRKSNDTVREIGGWRAYAREIQGGASPAATRPSSPASTSEQQTRPADPHQGHHK